MRCIVPGCDVDSTSITEGITFHRFPMEPTLCKTWLKSLGKESWQPSKGSVVCSKHFQKNDLYVTRDGGSSLRDDAVPIGYVQNAPKCEKWAQCDLKICRVCFATDCSLYSVMRYKNLDKAYEMLTGVPIEKNNLPPYLCPVCNHRLLQCIQFRNRSIQANLTIQEISQKQGYVTLEAIRTSNKYQLLNSKMDTRKTVNHYDLDIKHVEETVQNDVQEQPEDLSKLYDVNVVKVERSDLVNQEITDPDPSYDSMRPLRLHEVTLPGIKLEPEDLYTPNNLTHDSTDDYETRVTTVGIQIKVEPMEIANQDSVEDAANDADHVSCKVEPIGEDYSSDDGLSLGHQGLEGNLTRYKVAKVPMPSTNTIDQHWAPLSQSDDMPIINDKLPSEMDSSEHNINSNTETKLPEKSICQTNDKQNLKINSDKTQKHSCYICMKTFSRKHKLQLHLKVHSGEKPYSCEVCKNAFITKHMLSIHMRVHSGEKPFKCSECGKSFSQKGNLHKHLRIHSGEKPYSCNVCVKSFTQKSNLNKHLKIHSGEKPYTCELCTKAFNQLTHLENHLKTHSGEKPYSCNVCDKLFTIKCNLNKHLRLHSSEKRYSCKYCNKGFNENNRYQTHLRVHLGEKPFACSICNKAFSAKSCLQSHLKIHSDEKPYVCDVCKKSFRHKNRLGTHLITHS